MIRSSKHTLKFANPGKIKQIKRAYENYRQLLIFYIEEIRKERLPLKIHLSSKILPEKFDVTKSVWKQIAYKDASQNVRSQLEKLSSRRYKRYKKIYLYFKIRNRQIKFTNKRFKELKLKSLLKHVDIQIKNISIDLDIRCLKISKKNNSFDMFLRIALPDGHRNWIWVPIKYHRHSLKFINWNCKNTTQLSKINNNFYLTFFYEKEEPVKKTKGKDIGIDIGYKKLIVDSDGNDYKSKELEIIYKRLANKKRGSKNYQRFLMYKRDKINECCNRIDVDNLKTIVIEDLKSVKYKSKFNHLLMNKMQYWCYPQVIKKLKMLTDEHGISLVKVSPAYTSMTCSNCNSIDRQSRNGELFKCRICNIKIDADHNAAINILHRGLHFL